MSVGKYSPTVSNWYSYDRSWWYKNGGGVDHVNYDKDGYDAYGYNETGHDRAGHHENEYIIGRWVGEGEDEQYVHELYDDVYSDWKEPVPTVPPAHDR